MSAQEHPKERMGFRWRKTGAVWTLHHRDAVILYVVPDGTYPLMWRIRMPDGQLSDMANLARTRDAASSVALGILNADREGKKSARVMDEGMKIYGAALRRLAAR